MDLKIQSKLISGNRNRNSFAEVVILLVVAVLFSMFIVKPKYNDKKVKAEELTAAEAQYKAVEADRKVMNDLISKLDNSKEELALLDQALPLQGRVTAMDLLIDNLVETSGMQLASIDTDDGASGIVAGDKKLLANPYGAERELQTIMADVTVTGPIEQFRQLLKLIEANSRLMDIDSILVSRQEDVVYKIRLKAYFYAPEYQRALNQE